MSPLLPRRWFRFSLLSFLLFVTFVGVFLGWSLRVTSDELAKVTLIHSLGWDCVRYDWEQATIKEMAPGNDWYDVTTTKPDGTKEKKKAYDNNTYQFLADKNATQPEPNLLERLFRRPARVHVTCVMIDGYNVTEANVAQLRRLPNLKQVIVRNQYEAKGGPPNPTVEKVRHALPNV